MYEWKIKKKLLFYPVEAVELGMPHQKNSGMMDGQLSHSQDLKLRHNAPGLIINNFILS